LLPRVPAESFAHISDSRTATESHRQFQPGIPSVCRYPSLVI
jgi:hypothetical protein